ncbi:Protein MCM10-like protein, partial [Stegodyphus mimosarum]
MFTAPAKQSSKSSSKDKLTLSSLPLKQKAESVENEERVKGIKKLEDMYGPEVVKTLETKSEFINEQLAVPSAGSRNLLQHLVGEKMRKEGKVQTITPKELLKMHERQMKEKLPTKGKSDSSILKNLIPQLGKGLTPGQNVMFDISTHKASKIISQQELTKLRAIEKIKNKGPLKRKDPNSVKPSSEGFKKVKAVLDKSLEEENESRRELEKGMLLKDSKLGNTDLNSERIKDILNRKSSHAHEVEMAETEREEIYFDKLEKKEQMLEKMASTREIVCDVVSCKQCKYTAESAADRCKVENHPLKCHKAIKRFFICLNCRRHRHCFTKYPQRPCRYCHGQKFERTGMIKPQSGPLLDTEKLLIRGEEIKFINK